MGYFADCELFSSLIFHIRTLLADTVLPRLEIQDYIQRYCRMLFILFLSAQDGAMHSCDFSGDQKLSSENFFRSFLLLFVSLKKVYSKFLENIIIFVLRVSSPANIIAYQRQICGHEANNWDITTGGTEVRAPTSNQ